MSPFATAPWYLGDGQAVLVGDTDWEFAALWAAVAERARRLVERGLAPGQLVLVPTSPPLDLVLMQFALARCDAALLPVSAGLSLGRRAALVALTGAEWIWVPGVLGRLEPQSEMQTAVLWCDDPLALVIETSGSSGAPKAAMLSQDAVLASATQVNARLALGPGDLWLCCLPRHHIGGLAIAYRCALAGATLLLHQGFDATAVAADLVRRRVTHLSLVPPMLARLLDHLPDGPPPALRVALVGGQGLSPALAQRALDAGWPLYATYGMTETGSQVASCGPLTEAPVEGVVGLPLPGLTLDCPACGEPARALRLRGELVMAGYANPGRIPGMGLDGGWLTTADLACRTPNGDLRILGRSDEALVIAGEQVFPALVGQRLMGAPGVGAVVLLGLPDDAWGHRLVAVYVGEAEPAALARWCDGHLTRAERPRSVLRLDALPVLASGKYDMREIRRLVGAG